MPDDDHPSDAALLALIVDDADAIQVLAAWAGLRLPLAATEDMDEIERLASLTTGAVLRTKRAVDKLRVARVLTDGGITELADKMLRDLVELRLTGAPKGKR